MKSLNLAYLEKSDIEYKISKFPDGQQDITISNYTNKIFIKKRSHNNHLAGQYIEGDKIVQIKSRLNNFMDLELILCATKALRRLGVNNINLFVPYLLGSRCDRKFEVGGTSYLCDVIAPILNAQKYNNITVFDPHSSVTEACFGNLIVYNNKDLVKWVNSNYIDINNSILIAPDAGASHKIYKLAEQIGFKGKIIICSKERDISGKLTKCVIPTFVESAKKDIIIIDDICDGGNTFINISKAIQEACHNNKIYLIVTHGIFSQGFSKLKQHFNGLYCTNSYSDLPIKDTEIAPKPHNFQVYEGFVKQLNIF